MAAPIVIELVADPPPRAEFVDRLVASCTTAAGAGGCTLGTAGAPVEARARVVVALDGDFARVRVEVVASASVDGPHAREVAFREDDPLFERFRSVGLVVAGLIFDLEHPPSDAPAGGPDGGLDSAPASTASERSEPSVGAEHAPASPPTASPAVAEHLAVVDTPRATFGVPIALSAAGLLGWASGRPWWGGRGGADFPLGFGHLFAGCSAVYEETLYADSGGISEHRAAFGAGVGLGTPVFSDRIDLRARVDLELQDVRASILQPGTGRSDAGGRFLLGVGAAADAAFPARSAVALVAGGQLVWLGDSTTVLVQGKPATTIPPWAYALTVGLTFRIR
jgi:hypothetical protein